MAVISDFYEDPEVVIRTMEPLRFRGNELILFHVLDPKEIEPGFRRPVLLVDMESERCHGRVSGIRADGVPGQDRRATSRVCASSAKRAGMDYFLLDTSRPLDEALREYLVIRQGRM